MTIKEPPLLLILIQGKIGNEDPDITLLIQHPQKSRFICISTLYPSPHTSLIILRWVHFTLNSYVIYANSIALVMPGTDLPNLRAQVNQDDWQSM